MINNKLLSPFQKFIKSESLAGMLLFGATILALIWANSPYGNYYEKIWQYKIGISFQNFHLVKPLILWINDGLMAIFFFLIGLELKRELLIGEINSIKKAGFPLLAALGGILVPVGLYLFLNHNPATTKGWGIPMATDIAFALAIITTLGNRIPLSLKIFLTAFAIIDDIAAVLVIAIFYSSNIEWLLIFYGLLLIIFLAFYYSKKDYNLPVGLIIATIAWILFLKSGIHPTIAGVLLAFTIPVRKKIDIKTFSNRLSTLTNEIIHKSNDSKQNLLSQEEINYLDNLNELTSGVRSPLQSLEQKLHSWIAYFILPVFALANAGVKIQSDFKLDYQLLINIAVSLAIGKFIGVTLFSYIGIKLKLTELPSGVKFNQILGIAAIAGVGFTMSIFITNLAFNDDLMYVNSSKIGIIIGSLFSGIVGYILLRLVNNSR